ncbi:MAG: hypothetical protein JO295_00310, partial [Verrucomicrobia bacterium]|nr:hypothetical protein [Verrucomicrobiota bacterium]
KKIPSAKIFTLTTLLLAAAWLTLPFRASRAALSSPAEDDKTRAIPESLKPWIEWVTWRDGQRECPTPYSDSTKHLCLWPSRLNLQTDRAGGRFNLEVTVFHDDTWVPLPGGADAWPLEVKANGAPVPVVEHGGEPAVRLPAGATAQRLEGIFRWNDMPQRISLPREIGILSLTIDGKSVETPTWDAQGFLWLKRDGSTEEADKDFLSIKVYSALEDGIPLWLRTELELTVSGKSREEALGTVLPEGWKLAAIESSLPVAVDDTGKAKAQVRAGKWTVRISAFRSDQPKEIRYAAGATPTAAEQLVAFRAQPEFRMVEITGASSIDVSQTTFPQKWRELPVYRWDTSTAFRLEERMRGMGEQKPAGLAMTREWWLDESGRGLTFRDLVTGQMQQIWRLDAAPGEDLGAVRNAGQGQLITRNPQNAAAGVEVRTRTLNLEATGRMARTPAFSATGWRADADSLRVTLNLPPGWRLFALFGADWVQGDWLTAWTLLDLFLLLIFALAVFRLWGVVAAAVAFFAFGLSYHEPDAPRFVWLLLLVPLALARVVPEGHKGRRALGVAKWLCIALFVLVLVPFVVQQVQQALYPQLEVVGPRRTLEQRASSIVLEPNVSAAPNRSAPEEESWREGGEANKPAAPPQQQQQLPRDAAGNRSFSYSKSANRRSQANEANLNFDAKARIQTGPGVPEWRWRVVTFGWNGPVQAAQQVRPVLISLGVERLLTILRIALLLALSAILLRARQRPPGTPGNRRWFWRFGGGKAAAAATAMLALIIFGMIALAAPARAQAPDATTLEQLRARLLEPSDAYPHAAELPTVALSLNERRLSMDADVHTALRVAVPLPGRLPAWLPVSVTVDGKPESALRREDGYLWVVLPAGVHRVHVEGLLADVTEWEWTFPLKPRQVKIDAPGWTFTGVRPDGVPEAQVFFSRQQKTAAAGGGGGAAEAAYDRNDLQSIAVVERQLEIGLVWQVSTTVTRLSPVGKAIALRVPLLPGENVLTSNAVVRDGFIEVRLGAQETAFTWESGLAMTDHLTLATRAADTWVERWRLVISPVWNLALSGLAPVFEADAPQPVTSNSTIAAAGGDLIPIWQPWPGESVELTLSRPEAIAGATVTVLRGTHEISLGSRQRVSKLDLALRSSLGEDFLVDLPADAEVTSLTHNGRSLPARKDSNRLIVPLRPGEQAVSIGWKINAPLGVRARVEEVQLPVESANLTTVLTVPADRWALWTDGPRQGPVVRFWGILVCSLLAAFALSRVRLSPLRLWEWTLLVIGLTQVPLPAALFVVGWLFFLAWRGQESFARRRVWEHNTLQVLLIGLTLLSLGTLLAAVGEGLLGSPEMFITGNGSSRTVLRWFQARCEALLPRPGCVTISIWWYRLFMLAWALWLATALLRWLRWGWENFSRGGLFRHEAAPPPSAPTPLRTTTPVVPPPLPKSS